MSTVITINSLDEFHELIGGDKAVVIDFWATWCGPCRIISPTFEKLAETDASGNTIYAKVDVDQQEDITQEAGIRVMPTFITFRNGNKVDELLGADPSRLTTMVQRIR